MFTHNVFFYSILLSFPPDEVKARVTLDAIEGIDKFVYCKNCNVVVPLDHVNNGALDTNATVNTSACRDHISHPRHMFNVQAEYTAIEYFTAKKSLVQQGYDDKTFAAVEGLNPTRLFCMPCGHLLRNTKPTTIGEHVSSNKHQQNIGKKQSKKKSLLNENKHYLKQNEEQPNDIDCLVCNGKLTNPSSTNLAVHLASSRHVGILKESDEMDITIPPSEVDKPFAVQREKYKLRDMRTAAKHHNEIEVKLNEDEMVHKFHCTTCEKFLIGRTRQAVDRHVTSHSHLKNQRDEKGEKLDDFLYRLFKVWSQCKYILPFMNRNIF